MVNGRARVVVIGAGGRLGAALVREFATSADVIGFDHAQLDLGQLPNLRATLEPLPFEAMINAAALTNVDYCESHANEAECLNAEAPRILAELCREKGARFVHVSTDYVFDGEKRTPYLEEDPAEAICVYGESKRLGEVRVLEANDRALVIRVSWVFGPDRPSFVDAILRRAREAEEVAAVADKFSTPTYTHDLARNLRPLLEDQSMTGLLHLANRGACSWREYAQWAIDCCHRYRVPIKAHSVGSLSLGEMKNFVARRPVYTVLATEKYERLTGRFPRDWHEAVEEYVREHYRA